MWIKNVKYILDKKYLKYKVLGDNTYVTKK